MATNLNPGADATLVSAAYRAAVADTPGDYSRTLERAADSYEKTMEASSDMWGKVAQVGAAIGGEMMKNAQELTDMVAKGATLNPTDTEMFTDEIYGIKDELNALGTFNGQFGDRETRKTRAGLKIKQQELFAEIDNAVANLKVGADAVAAGTFDFDLAGLKDKEKINAIIKSNLKNNVTDNKNIAKLSRDENDELIYTLYDNATGQPTMVDGEPQTMTLKQFNESIATNVKDGGAMLSAFDKFTEQESNAGNGALNGTYDPERKQMTLNKLDTLLGDKPVNLKRAMRTPIGYSNTSFYDDLTSQSALSAGLYSTLVGVTGDGSGELIGKVVDGIEDIDNSGGISAEEIRNSGNYNVLVGNITGLKDAKVSKEFFKEYAIKQMEEAYKFGHRKKAPATGKDGKESGKRNYADRHYGPRGNTVEGNVLENIYQKFNDGAITMEDGGTWNRDPKTNIWTNDKTNETMSGDDMIGLAQDSAGGYSLGDDYLFSQFEGREGSSGGGTAEGSGKDLSPFFGPNANEENAVSKLKEIYPNLKISSPVGMREKIKVNDELFYLRGKGDSTPEMEMKRLQEHIALQSNETNTGGQVQTTTTTSTTFDPNKNLGEESTTTTPPARTTGGNNQQAPPTWRSNKKINAASVDQFNIKGSVGEGKANIFKNNKPINVKVGGGMATVTGVRADGDKLVVDVDAPFNMGGEKTMGEFSKSGNGFKFTPNKEIYKQLKGDDKKDFDAFVLAIETDPAFAMEIMKSVNGESDFNPADYK